MSSDDNNAATGNAGFPTGDSPERGASGAPLPPPRVPDHELLRRIGRGAYGEVWLARSVTGAYRAVKIVHRQSFDHDRPFEREFEGILKFEPISRRHESQVDILHVGRGEDSFYYVMELADDQATGGQIHPDRYTPRTLKSDLMFHTRLPFEECVQIGVALATALQQLHENGLVHRDVKPSNIIFVNGVPKLADIGLVTGVDATRSFVGTEGFAAPEGPGTAQADFFSLGKVLYEMSTGKDRQQFPELPTQLRELPDREGLMELNTVIVKACRHDPKDRYASAAAMRADLELLQSGKSLARLHRIERQLRIVRRAGALVTVFTALVATGWFYQAHETRVVREIAAEKSQLAEQKSRLADENRLRLVHERVANGVRQMNVGNLSEALLWLTEALPLVESDPHQTRMHRIRIQAILDQMPRLLYALPHKKQADRCWFSSNGKTLLTFAGSSARVWDTATGHSLTPPMDNGSEIRFGGLSPDGSRVLTCGDDGVMRVWDSSKGWRKSIVGSNVTFCAWAPKGNSILVCFSNRVAALMDVATGLVRREFIEPDARTIAGVFSADGLLLALADNQQRIHLWDATSGERYGVPLKLERRVSLTAFGVDRFYQVPMKFDVSGRRLAIATGQDLSDMQVEVWDVATQRRVFGPTSPSHGVLQGFALDAGGLRLALITDQSSSTSDYGDLELWDVETGRQLRTLTLISGSGVKFLPKAGSFAVTSWLNFAQLWDPITGNHLTPPLTHSAWVLDVAASPDEQRLATASDDGLVKLWRLGSHSEVKMRTPSHNGRTPAMLCADSNPDETLIATGGSDGVVRLWNVRTGKLMSELADPRGNPVVAIQWSSDGSRILALPGVVKAYPLPEPHALLWNVHSGQLVASFAADPQSGHVGAMSQDGSRIAVIQPDQAARVWSAADGRAISPELHFSARLECISFSPDGRRVVVGGYDNAAHVCDVSSGREILPPLRPPDARREVGQAVFSPDGRRILTVGGDQWGRIWDATSGALIAAFKHDGNLYLAAWHPSGNRVITGGLSPDIRTWDAHDGHSLLPPMHHGLGLHTLCYSEDGRLIASASFDHTVRVWDSSTGGSLLPPVDHGQPVWAALLLDGGRRVFSAGEDGIGRFTRLVPTSLPTESLREYARAVSGYEIDSFEALRKLSKDEVVKNLRQVRARHPEFFAQP